MLNEYVNTYIIIIIHIYIYALLIFAFTDAGKFSFAPFSQSDPKLLVYFF